MKESLSACLANFGAVLVFAIVLFVSFVVLAIALMLVPILGWLALVTVATVVYACAEYVAWRQVYGAAAGSVPPPVPDSSQIQG
jgi:hypothetical protein